MTLTKKLLAAAVLMPLIAGVGAADAARPKPKPKPKKPTCNLIKDGAGDATDTGTGTAAPNDARLDIVGGDIATNATTLTAIIKVASLQSKAATDWPGARAYDLTFTVRGAAQSVRAIVSAQGTTWPKDGKGVVDTAKNEIRISVPIASLKVPFKPNDKITQISANAWRYVLAPSEATVGRADQGQATTPSSYTASWPSCVKVGA